jgi:hypothetical protein
MRFGEKLPNPFAQGEVTHWFHPLCAAYKRPDAIAEALKEAVPEGLDAKALEAATHLGLTHHRVPRIDGAERSPSSQARCRHCKEPIEKGEWRIRLVFHEEGNFAAAGFVHLKCRGPYFEAADILGPVLHFSRALGADDRAELARVLAEP